MHVINNSSNCPKNDTKLFFKRGGAAEACWAHNPKVPRSKLGLAICPNNDIKLN